MLSFNGKYNYHEACSLHLSVYISTVLQQYNVFIGLHLYYYLLIICIQYVIRLFQAAVKMNRLHTAQNKYFKIWYFLLLS